MRLAIRGPEGIAVQKPFYILPYHLRYKGYIFNVALNRNFTIFSQTFPEDKNSQKISEKYF